MTRVSSSVNAAIRDPSGRRWMPSGDDPKWTTLTCQIGGDAGSWRKHNPGRQARKEDRRKRYPGSNEAAKHCKAPFEYRSNDNGIEKDNEGGYR
jgi:hypothetical protein